MQVSIVKQTHHEKGYQIMIEKANCFYHVYPGKLFTLEEAKQICSANGFNVVSIGSIWHCASK